VKSRSFTDKSGQVALSVVFFGKLFMVFWVVKIFKVLMEKGYEIENPFSNFHHSMFNIKIVFHAF